MIFTMCSQKIKTLMDLDWISSKCLRKCPPRPPNSKASSVMQDYNSMIFTMVSLNFKNALGADWIARKCRQKGFQIAQQTPRIQHFNSHRGLFFDYFYNVFRKVAAVRSAEGSNAPHPVTTSTCPSRRVEEVSSTPRPIENCEGFSFC